MNISLAGINHRTAPVAIREKAAIRAGKINDTLQLLRSYISHGVILSTCNRMEVYTIRENDSYSKPPSLDFLRAQLGTPDALLCQHTYVLDGEAAVKHLFRTASGLDSMIIGEYEVLGQVKQALEIAEKGKVANLALRRIFQSAIRTGRRVREETGISRNALSVGSVSLDLAARVVSNLADCRMLVIGTGEAGKLVAKAARDRGITQIVVASRTRDRAADLTEMLGGIPISINNLMEELDTCNIIVTCADTPHCILNAAHVEAAMQRRSGLPLVIIDIAVPRNVESLVAQINDVFLYNIDDLSKISEKNRWQRELEVRKAEVIISEEMDKFKSWWQDYKVRPVIRAIMKNAEKIRRSHLDSTVKKLSPLSDEERYNLEMMTRAIVRNILKDPIDNIKANGHSNRGYTEMVKDLFKLDEEKGR